MYGELNNALARLDRRKMCGTFAILSPDLFTYVYSRIPPGREREFIQKDEDGRGCIGERCGWEKIVARVPRRKGSSVRMEDGVSHELEKQPKAAFAPFLKFFTTFFDAPPPCCRTGERSRKRQRERAISPLPSFLFFRYLLLRSRNVHTRSAYPYPVDVCQTVSVFISWFIAPLHVR